MRRVLSLLVVMGAMSVLASGTGASATGTGALAAQEYPNIGSAECYGLVTPCQSVVSPWVKGIGTLPQSYMDWNWSLDCPGGTWLAGMDTVQDGAFAVAVRLNVRDEGGSAISSIGTGGGTYQLKIGCTPVPLNSSPGAGPPEGSAGAPRVRGVMRVKERRLRANRTVVRRHRCARGERAVAHGFGVGFFTKNPPSRRELKDVQVSGRRRAGVLRVRVRTGPRAGDNELLKVQLGLLCRPARR